MNIPNWAPATGRPAGRQRRGPAEGCRPSASFGPRPPQKPHREFLKLLSFSSMPDSMLGSPRPGRRRRAEGSTGTPLKKQKCGAIVPAPSPARSSHSVKDEEYLPVDGPEFDDDEEKERCNCTHVEIIFVENETRVNESTGVRTEVKWYKVTLDGVSNFICVDPKDGVKVWGGDSAKETEAHSYDSIADLMENLQEDHSRHCVPGEGVSNFS